MSKNNTLQYFGLVNEKKPSTNEIWALTIGDWNHHTAWLSESAANDIDLRDKVINGVKSKRKMMLAVPVRGFRTQDFADSLKPGRKTHVMRIRVLDPQIHKFLFNIFLQGVKVESVVTMADAGNGINSAFYRYGLRVDAAGWEGA